MSDIHFRSQFDQQGEIIFLNSGSLSKSPKVVVQSMLNNILDYEKNPTYSLFETWPRLRTVQEKVASFFHAEWEDVFLRSNITEVLNDFILGIYLKSKGTILVTDVEYGAIVNICKLRAKKNDSSFEVFETPIPSENKTSNFLERLESRFKKNDVRLFLLSHVVTATGWITPIQEIAKLANRYHVRLIIDGAHSAGALPLDFRELEGVDAYAANLHKWMMGPKGSAFGWAPKRMHSEFEVIQAGWASFEVNDVFECLRSDDHFAAKMARTASNQFCSFFALPECIQFWEKFGANKIRESLNEIGNYLVSEMQSKTTLNFLGSSHLLERGPLYTFKLPEKWEGAGFQLTQELLEKYKLQVITPQLKGKTVLRISPHIYNTKNEIDSLIAILHEAQISC